jgi:hypothetical protein
VMPRRRRCRGGRAGQSLTATSGSWSNMHLVCLPVAALRLGRSGCAPISGGRRTSTYRHRRRQPDRSCR